MIGLAARLTAGSGREPLIRLLLTSAGMALAVTMLLFAAVAFPALDAHDARRAWIDTSPQNEQPDQDESTTDPLLWRLTEDRFDGRDLLRVDLAAEGPDAPVPPGLRRLPGPGEVAVSPALGELLDRTDPALLADRFPGRITATVGRDALVSPDALVVFVGRSPAELRDEGDHVTVRSIESAPVSRELTNIMRLVFVIGGVGLLVPVVVFVATATRLAAARREQRLAALRLAGATTGQVGIVAAVEAALAATAGVAVGFGAFLALRPWVARIPFDGASFYPSDLRLSPVWAAVVGLGVPVLAVGAATVSLRRLRISPLGVARRARRARPTGWPLLLVVAGLVGLPVVALWDRHNTSGENTAGYLVGVAFLTMILGIVLSGPWLTAGVARGIARCSRRAPSLLAARRLQDDPSAGFRAISGIIVAVFVGTVFSGLAASIFAAQEVDEVGLTPDVVIAAPGAQPDDQSGLSLWSPTLEPSRAGQLVDDLGAVPGVRQVVTAHPLPDDPDLRTALARSGAESDAAVMVSCADAAALGFERCDGATVVNVSGYDVEPTGVTPRLAVGELADLPVVAVAATTDGQAATIERARTLLELGFPGTPAVTRSDVDAVWTAELDTLQRISNIGLSGTLVIAGCSLAVAVAGAIVERRQPFALLRLSGVRLSDLRRVVVAEAAAPLLMVATASVGLGLVVAALLMSTGTGGEQGFVLPGLSYWVALAGGLAVALLVVVTTLPLLNRLTSLDSTRFE